MYFWATPPYAQIAMSNWSSLFVAILTSNVAQGDSNVLQMNEKANLQLIAWMEFEF